MLLCWLRALFQQEQLFCFAMLLLQSVTRNARCLLLCFMRSTTLFSTYDGRNYTTLELSANPMRLLPATTREDLPL
jgi:hypothetical protein